MFLDFFDEVYVINLKRRTDRAEFMCSQLTKAGIPFRLFEATEHKDGAIGLVLTMKRLLTEALSLQQSNILILEDDAKFLVPDPVLFLKHVLPQLPRDYHLFYLGLNLLARPVRISDNILKVTDCYSTHAIAYSKYGMEACLERLQLIPDDQRKPYDIFMREEIVCRGGAYCTYPMLATQNESYSDIENNIPPWGKLMAQTFALHTKTMYMATEVAICPPGHAIDGVVPTVDPNKFEIQNHHLIGRICDCKKLVYSEKECGCTVKQWEITWQENIQ